MYDEGDPGEPSPLFDNRIFREAELCLLIRRRIREPGGAHFRRPKKRGKHQDAKQSHFPRRAEPERSRRCRIVGPRKTRSHKFKPKPICWSKLGPRGTFKSIPDSLPLGRRPEVIIQTKANLLFEAERPGNVRVPSGSSAAWRKTPKPYFKTKANSPLSN